MGFAAQIRAAEEEIARLKDIAGAATCAEIGEHDWRHIGGASCGCDDGGCSVPVHECARCKDCDYGDNAEAAEVRQECTEAAVADRRGRHQIRVGRAWLASRLTPAGPTGDVATTAPAPRAAGTGAEP